MEVSSLNSLLKAEPAVLQWIRQQGWALVVVTAELVVGVTVHQRSVWLED